MESEGYSSAQNENLGREETVAHLKRKRSKKGKRFNDEQIKSLESIFKVETKLEAKKKLQLARELGLQPRQIAIWFQNRRARWKSKQIEEEYKGLKASFDSLSMEFESLKKERESLLIQLERLSNLVGSPKDGHSRTKDSEDHNGTSNGGADEAGNKNHHEFNEEPSSLLVNRGSNQHQIVYANNNNEEVGVIRNTEEQQKQAEPESFKFSEYAGESCSLASPEEWCNLDLGGLFTQSCGTSSKWWEF